ncbi:MAG: FliM/FliN family flagellar motor switch protein [Rhodoblastus sp.]
MMEGDGRTNPIADSQGDSAVSIPSVSANFDAIPLTLRVVLGAVTMSIGDIARLRAGALIRLDRRLGEPVDLMVDDRLVCRGEIGVTDDTPPRFVFKIVELNARRRDGLEP